jgi:hypothetical protein
MTVAGTSASVEPAAIVVPIALESPETISPVLRCSGMLRPCDPSGVPPWSLVTMISQSS